MQDFILNDFSYEVYEFFPRNFFNKNNNEEFIKFIMKNVLPDGKWVKGNVNLHEPDYFYNGIPLEFTMASDKKRKNNFIFRLKNAKYLTENIEQDLFKYITQKLEDKAKKKYLVSNNETQVYLCVLCLLDRYEWISDFYGSKTHFITDLPREKFFNEIKQKYLETNVFKGIYIIFPDIMASWWVWDLNTENKAKLTLVPPTSNLRDCPYPFIIARELYDKFKQLK